MFINKILVVLHKKSNPDPNMIYTITIILSVLVGINFLLLKYSCNKTVKSKKSQRPHVIKTQITPKITTSPQLSRQLAATGS